MLTNGAGAHVSEILPVVRLIFAAAISVSLASGTQLDGATLRALSHWRGISTKSVSEPVLKN